MSKGDEEKTREQLIEELDELRNKMVQLVSLSELETIFKIVPDTYFRIDEDGTILDFKAGQYSELFKDPAVFLGGKIGEIYPLDAAKRIMRGIERAKITQALTLVEYSLEFPGGIQHYEARLLPFGHGQFLSVFRNITHYRKLYEEIAVRKKKAEELHVAKEAAEAASQLKSQFLANMSHDIRTPLNSILGFANLLLKNNPEEKSRNYLGKIISAGDGLLNLLNDILDFSKIEAGQLEIYPQSFLLEELVESLKSMFELQFKLKGIDFEIKINPNEDIPKRIYSDKWRINQVLTNFISNAFKFTEKGQVTVEISYNLKTDRLKFIVMDTGIGIPEEKRMDIFKPFTRLQVPGTLEKGGIGIGLAICKNLITLMGGEIGVIPCENSGTTFFFEIPAESAKAQKKPLTQKLNVALLLALSKKTGNNILIVDDNPVNRELIIEQLKDAGFFSLLTACNGFEAVQIAQQNQPDLILMDIQMPGMDGNEAIQELRASGFKQPIIALSAFAMKEHIEKSLNLGADAYITKPIDFDRFLSQISPFLKDKESKGNSSHPHLAEATKPVISIDDPLNDNSQGGLLINDSVSDRVRKVFLKDAKAKLKVLQSALKNNATNFDSKRQEINRIAHIFKGNTAVIGLSRLEAIARQLEHNFMTNESKEILVAASIKLKEILSQIVCLN